jgi:hypothetical protein
MQEAIVTFAERNHAPDTDGTERGKLTVCRFHEEERHSTQYEEDDVRQQEYGCKDRG